jgi:HPt (histidine-containing phosphotransfer) domain-containing protein
VRRPLPKMPDFEPPEWIEQFRAEGAMTEIRELVGTFMAENERRREPLRAAAAVGDMAALASIAHATIGSAGSFGAPRLHHLAVQLEERAAAGATAEAAALAASLDAATGRASAAMKRYIDLIECRP